MVPRSPIKAKSSTKTNPDRAEENPIRVFVVENHPDTLLGLRTVLELLGYAVASATTVDAALKHAATAQFDVLLSDISLPDGDGWDLMRRLRKRQPVQGIAMSGFGMNADLLRSKEAGFSAHLIKPFMPEELDAAIRRLVKCSRPNGAAASETRRRVRGTDGRTSGEVDPTRTVRR